jgi:hypothetical protein
VRLGNGAEEVVVEFVLVTVIGTNVTIVEP